MTEKTGVVVAVFICPTAGEPMWQIQAVQAVVRRGLVGDRYFYGKGSFNKNQKGRRQVTLINGKFFQASGFEYAECRRNIVTLDVELMWLIGREFQVDGACLRGLKYCDPCQRPNQLSGNRKSFKETFSDCGGLIAEVIEGGVISVGGSVVSPPKGY